MGLSSPDLDRPIELWPALPFSVQQASYALPAFGNPDSSTEVRARLGAEVVASIQSLEH